MDRVGQAGRDLRLMWSRLLLVLAAAVFAVCAAWSAVQIDAVPHVDPTNFGSLGIALLVLSVALVTFAALYIRASARQQRLAAELREARATLRRVDEMLDVWQWQTDGSNRLVEMRAPQTPSADRPHEAWRPEGAPFLWEHFVAEDTGALRRAIERGAPLEDLPVRHRDPGVARRALLRARACADAAGLFCGYQGTLREIGSESNPSAAASPGVSIAAKAMAPHAAGSAGASAAAATSATAQAESDSFSYSVSHDLRAPIRVVEGFTKIVKEDYGRLLDRVGNDHLDRVLGAAARMNNMIDALLALSKLSSQPLVRQTVSLSQLAVYVADDLRRQSPGRQVGISIQPDMQVEGDPTLLRVVIENLLGNAWKYTGKCEQAQIWFERDAGTDSFIVRDNGAGFDMRFADRLFGVFQRLHSANDFPGTGVGLATVRRVVRRHGGDIWGEAEPGRGARFHFTLPQDMR